MDDLIRRSDVIRLLRKIEKLYHETYVSNVRAETVANCIGKITDIPAAAPVSDVQEVTAVSRWEYRQRHRKSFKRYTGVDDYGEKHTIIVKEEYEGLELYCGRCGAQAAESWQNHCPKCGARMEE